MRMNSFWCLIMVCICWNLLQQLITYFMFLGNVRDRILVFATSKNLDLLSRSEDIYVDGTFKCAPIHFKQVFTIHGIFNGTVLPLVFCLLPNKLESTYKLVLEKLKELRPTLNPKTMMSDFERAIHNSFKTVFPETRLRGCFFHFNQCFYRWESYVSIYYNKSKELIFENRKLYQRILYINKWVLFVTSCCEVNSLVGE